MEFLERYDIIKITQVPKGRENINYYKEGKNWNTFRDFIDLMRFGEK